MDEHRDKIFVTLLFFMAILYNIIVVVAGITRTFISSTLQCNRNNDCFHYGSKYSNKRYIDMKPWVSKWLHGEATLGQLFNEDVQTMNKVNPNFFPLFV